MKLRIISWNVRGLNDRGKREVVSGALSRWRPDIVCLQETKLGTLDRELAQSIWGGRWEEWCCLDSVGASGGVVLMWDSRVVEKMDVLVGRWSLSCLFRCVDDGLTWSLSGV